MSGDAPGSVERTHRLAIEALVPGAELHALEERRWTVSARNLAVIWIEIVALLVAVHAIVTLPLWYAVAPAVVVIVALATRINALNVVMHEASHGFLTRRRSTNDWLCNTAAAWWMLHSVEEYRPAHRLHHRYLNTDRDPDLESYLVDGRPGALWRLVVRDLTGVTALKRALVLLAATKGHDDAEAQLSTRTVVTNLVGKAAVQLLVLGQFVVFRGIAEGVLLYVVFWLVPVLCVFPLILRLKTITEHFDPRLRDRDARLWIVRTSAAGPVQNHVLGAEMEYHYEHHVVPTVPFHGLKQLHRRLDAAGFFDEPSSEHGPVVLSGGYVRFLRHYGRVASGAPTLEPTPR